MRPLLLALCACSLTAIHYREPARDVDCERLRLLPVADTVAAAGAFGIAAYQYNAQARTTPWPIGAIVAGAWAVASASYGYYETERCRAETTLRP